MNTILMAVRLFLRFSFVLPLWIAATQGESAPIHPDLLQKFEPRVFASGPAKGEKLNYRLFQPAQVSGQSMTNFPLVLILHGAAGLGEDNARQFNGGNEVPALALIDPTAQAKHPCFVLAPQCPRGESWSASGRHPARCARLSVDLILHLQKSYRIDRTRIYLVGLSMGGHGAWDMAARFPGTFAAIVPICGAALDASQARRLVEMPIWCFHGRDDPLVNVANARRMISWIRAGGGAPKYTEYPGVGHDSYRNAFRESELLPWLFSKQRKP